ncbi:MAG: MBL fold metallo-hydrolase, partial [Nitrospirota bacterium]
GFSKHKPALPLYTQEDAERVLGLFRTIPYGTKFDLGDGLNLKLTQSGHIIGSAFVALSNGKTSILFSGDLGRENDLIIRPPEFVTESDYLVIESTYGDRMHDPADPQDQIAEIINRTAARNGVIIVPAFSVGRTQTLLYLLHLLKMEGRIPGIPVYLNSPMSISATGIFFDYPGEHRLNSDQCAGLSNVAKYINSPEESKALNEKNGPMIIISASGMATGGRVIHHLKAFAPDPNNAIIFTGFQAAGTRGASMLANAESVKIHGEYIPVRAEVNVVHNLSAHADQGEILKWLSHFRNQPKTT